MCGSVDVGVHRCLEHVAYLGVGQFFACACIPYDFGDLLGDVDGA